jgi:NAD(P)-dependent dehydrogenase (short-subunit alcohol dehydrogenase family)
MMKGRWVLITGATGGIGQALCAAFHETGWSVLASDRIDGDAATVVPCKAYVEMDLTRFCVDAAYREARHSACLNAMGGGPLHALVNNAAVQIVAPFEQIDADAIRATLDVNLVAPFLLIRAFLPQLEAARGAVVNVASIHAATTKPHFSAYATSKAGLVGMTRALAVELGDRIRVNAICPAAIATPMLIDGFKENPKGLSQLAEHHPTKRIGRPAEVASLVRYLAESDSPFLNGAIIGLDGGIASRLHDPV